MVNIFLDGINPKMNIIAQLELELANNDIAIH